MSQLPVFEALQRETGIGISFIHPPAGQYALRFQIMLAGGRLPDIISHDFLNDYSAGIGGALADEVIMPIDSELMRQAPYLSAFLDENPRISSQLTIDTGGLFCVPALNIDDRTTSYMGPFVRMDLLEKHEMQSPRTVPELESTLAVFGEDPEIDIPLGFYGGNFQDTRFLIGSYGITWDFFLRDGRIAYGPMESEFRPFIERLHTWFRNGWLDPGVIFNSREIYRKQIARKNIGVFVDYVTNIDVYEKTLRKKYPSAVLEPISYPSLPISDDASDPPVIGHDAGILIPFASAYLSTDNTEPEKTMELLDFAYSPAGNILFNYGVEGESYTLLAGRPVLLEHMFLSEDGTIPLKKYVVSGPYMKAPGAFLQMLHTDAQKRAIDLWSDTHANAVRMPILIPDRIQGEKIRAVTRSVNKYMEDMIVDFVTGKRSMQ